MTGEHAFTILHYSGQHRENEIENVGGWEKEKELETGKV
jgi:hypothetical protein